MKKKYIIINSGVIECDTRCQNIFYWVKKKTCLGVFRIGENQNNDNETSLKEGGGIEMSTTVLHSRDALSLEYLPLNLSADYV